MSSFGLIIVGRTGSGKTTETKRLLDNLNKDVNLVVYDVNAEYTNYYNEPFEPDITVFMHSIQDIKSSVIVIDEASIFFENRATNKELKKILALKRHNDNIIILNFHSFAMIPDYVFHLINYVTVLKTNDNPMKIRRKFDNDRLIEAIDNVNNSSLKYPQMSFSLY